MQWLLNLLERQSAVIRDAFPSFVLVSLVAIAVLYILFERFYERRYKDRIEDYKERIESLKERLAECESAKKQELPASQAPANLEIRFTDRYIKDRGNYQMYRIGVYNSGSATANEVEALIMKIVPAPESRMFRADFPYQLKGVDGNLGKRNINPDREEVFELCESWIGGSTDKEVIIGKMDTKLSGEHFNFPMQANEVWRVYLEASGANTNRATAIFLFQPGDKWVMISRID